MLFFFSEKNLILIGIFGVFTPIAILSSFVILTIFFKKYGNKLAFEIDFF